MTSVLVHPRDAAALGLGEDWSETEVSLLCEGAICEGLNCFKNWDALVRELFWRIYASTAANLGNDSQFATLEIEGDCTLTVV